jgi:hypothetical protein
MDEKAHAALKKRHEDSWKTARSGPDRFLPISFACARFDGEANFSGRTFDGSADFSQARFYYPPDFDPWTKDARADFTAAYISFVRPGCLLHWTSETKVPSQLRHLRILAEDRKNHDLARDLYIEERKAERGVYWRQLSGLNELEAKLKDITEQEKSCLVRVAAQAKGAHCPLAQASRQTWPIGAAHRPLPLDPRHVVLLGACRLWPKLRTARRMARRERIFLLLALYRGPCAAHGEGPDIEKYKQAVRMLALGNTVPFVGPLTIDTEIKRFLFCPRCDPRRGLR